MAILEEIAGGRELAHVLDQQAATSEILRLIREVRSDAHPVLDAIAAAALRLLGATSANVLTLDAGLLHVAALAIGDAKARVAVREMFPRPPGRDTAAGRAVLTRGAVAIPDVLEDPDSLEGASVAEVRSVLGVPVMRAGSPIGAIEVGRAGPGPFSEREVALLQTFADQAVVATESARLLNVAEARSRELADAVDQQQATSEILRLISRSPTEVPFDKIVAAAKRLCSASAANMFTFDGELLHVAALTMDNPEGEATLRRHFPRPPSRGMAASRAILTRRLVAIHDTKGDAEYEWATAEKWGFRSVLCIPLMREGTPIGAIAVGRPNPGPFPESQVALLQTFADQAVIAIENVRLFKELAARTTQFARSVESMRALGEVGQAVSSTLDLEMVLSTIVSRATQLASMDGGAIYEYEEAQEEFRVHATDRLPEELVEALRSAPIPRGEGAVGRLAMTGEPVVIRDIMDEGMYQSRVREILLRLNYRSLLAVPLLREDRLLGGLVVNRKTPGEFEPDVVDLLKSFATQSALAIQNARLYREIEDKSRQLEVASRHKSAFLANMSHELRTPLNAIIGFTRIVMRRSQDRLEPKQYENLEKILASAQNLLSLINAVLDLAKVEAGRIEVNPSEVRLAAVLEQCMRTVEPLVKEGVTQVKAFGGELPSMIVDEEKLRQILINLLSNAAKFTSSGSIQVRARPANGSVDVAVVDTGIGIAADKLDLIFEEFEQAHAGTTREHGGTGLGLAIARRLARLMGGDIRVESEPGAGSTFTLTLPIRCPAPPP
jgi:signal transduction histidine kinase